jgi:hypothetical protein
VADEATSDRTAIRHTGLRPTRNLGYPIFRDREIDRVVDEEKCVTPSQHLRLALRSSFLTLSSLDIPIRNCSSGRDLSFTLRKFADSARQSYQEFQNLYARDLQCPQEWQEQCRKILPTEVQWGGRLDLFQWLPPCARSEVMMAYVGSEGSSSGFHRCFSSTVALNLLVESDGGCK